MTTPIQPAVNLDAHERQGLARLLALVLPGTDHLPSGADVGTHEELIDLVLRADPTLQDCVKKAAGSAADSDSPTLEDLESWIGEDEERVVFALTAAYYMSRQVREVLGYHGQERRPIAQAQPDEVASDELVAPVIERGSIYVSTDGL